MKKLTRWLLRLVGVAGVVAAAALALFVAVVPGVVERRALAALQAMGLEGASLEVRAVSLRSAEVANLRLDKGNRVRVGSLAALYELPSLLEGRLRVIEVTGARVHLAVRDGRLDLGPLADIETSGEGGGEFPFERIDLRASALHLDLEGRSVLVPIEGSIEATGWAGLRLDLRAEPEGSSVHLQGTIDTNTKAVALSAEGSVRDLGTPLSAIPRSLVPIPGRLSGRARFEVRYEGTPERGTAAVTLWGENGAFVGDVAGRRVDAEAVSWRLETRLDERRRLAHLVGRAETGTLRAGPLVVRRAALKVEQQGQRLVFSASAAGQRWRVETLDGHATGLLGLLAEESEEPLAAKVAWSARTSLPAEVVEAARMRGIDLSGLGDLATTGTATVKARRPKEQGAAWGWQAEIADATVTLAPGHLKLAAVNALLRDVAGELRLQGTASPGDLRLEVLPGSRLSAAEASARRRRLRAALAKGEEPAAEATVGQAIVFRAERGEAGFAWRLEAPELRATLRRGLVAEPTASVEGLAVEARLRLTATPTDITGSLLPGSRASAATLTPRRLGARLTKVDGETPLATLELGEDAATLSLSRREDAWSWQAAASGLAVEVAPVDVAMPGAGLELLGAGATLRLDAEADPQRARLALRQGSQAVVGSVATGGRNVRVTKTAGDAPLLAATVGERGLAAEAALGGEEADWRVPPSDLTLALAEASAEHVSGVVRAEGLRATAPLRLSARPDGLRLEAPTDWALAMRAAELKVGDEVLRVGETRLTLAGLEGRPVASVTLGGGELGLRVAGQAASDGGVTVAMGEGTTATAASVRASVSASRDPEGTALSAELTAEGIEGKLASALGGLGLEATTKGGRVRASVKGRAYVDAVADLPLSVDAEVAAGESAVTVKGEFGEATARLAGASVSGWAEVERGREPVVEARVSVRDASARCPAWEVAVEGVSAEVPVTVRSTKRSQGTVEVGGIVYGRSRLPGLSGSLGVADGRIGFDATWSPLPQATLKAEGDVDLSTGVPLGNVHAWMPRFTIGDEKELAGLVAEAEGIDLSGTFALDARLELLARRVLPRVVLKASEVVLGSKQYDATVEGLAAELTVTSFAPLSTPGHQRVDVARAKVGGLEVRDGFVEFRVSSPDSVFIERSEWGWAGGRLYTYALRFDPDQPIDLVVYGDRLALGRLLALIPKDRATGSGTLYGRLPVTVAWPELRFGEGFLYATPGERGAFKLTEDAEYLAAGLPRVSGGDLTGRVLSELRERVESALKDFEYDMFRTDFVHEGGALVAKVRLKGRGPEFRPSVPEPQGLLDRLFPPRYEVKTMRQEFELLQFNIPRFDEILSDAIIVEQVARGEITGAAGKGDTP
ncbi:MAG: intermembrane phospholipid transport protein YdbH family protein [bacterium]